MLKYVAFNTVLGQRERVYGFAEKLKFYASKGEAGIVANIYTGLFDFEEMSFLIHYLRPGDLFIDIGANVGEYSLLASGISNARSFAFEPVASTFQQLQRNITLNGLGSRIIARNEGVSSKTTTLYFTNNKGVMNHVVSHKGANTMPINVVSLDEAFNGESVDLLKIDVEGHEVEVLRGGHNLLLGKVRAVIIELNGKTALVGTSAHQIHEQLLAYGFQSIQYKPFERALTMTNSFNTDRFNTIYIKDFQFVNQRVKSADDILVFGQRY